MDANRVSRVHESHWSSLDQLSDLLFESNDLPRSLPKSLAILLQSFQRDHAAIYLIQPSAHLSAQWMVYPDGPWKSSWTVEEEENLLALGTQAFELPVGKIQSAPEYNLGGVFPLQWKKQNLGTLYISGNPILPEDYPSWKLYTRFISSMIFNGQVLQIKAIQDKEIGALRMVATANRINSDINDVQFHMVKNAREIFEAEEALLIILDEENPNLAIKKRLGDGEDWVYQMSLKLEPGAINDCIREHRVIDLQYPSADPSYNPMFDGELGVETSSFICAPLSSNGVVLGALALINPTSRLSSDYRKDLLEALSTGLGNAIYSTRLFLQLKISNADLEASRWELLNSRNTLRALFDSIPQSLYIVDQSYSLIAINMARAERVGEKPNLLVGKKCYEKLHNRNSPCPACRIAETLRAGRTTNRIEREWLDTERFVEWEVNTFPIYDENDAPTQAILSEQDVTEKRNLEANLIQSEKLAAVGQLAAGVAHEINNPLAAIIANAQILRRQLPADDEDVQESVKLIENAGIRASQVVRNLLGIARKENYEFVIVDLNETISNSLSLVQHEFMKRPIQLKVNLQENMPRVTVSKDHLQGVWINLIINAIDSIDKDQGLITITTQFTGTDFRVSVTDNGKGIPQDKLLRVFEPFFTTKIAGKGTGLGLSVSLRVIKQHGGNIQAESHLGKGSKFTVVLPGSLAVNTVDSMLD